MRSLCTRERASDYRSTAGDRLSSYGYRYYDPKSTKWLSRDPQGESGGINLTAFCANDPVNKVDPLGLEAYIVYRNFADATPGGKLKSRGHFFLAFDEKGLRDVGAWRDLVEEIGGYAPVGPASAFYNAPGTPVGELNQEDQPNPNLETFSFHPWSVYDETVGGNYSAWGNTGVTALDVAYTRGSYIGYGDAVDRLAFRNARDNASDPEAHTAVVFPLNLTDEQQIALYRAAIASRNINNESPESRDKLYYMLGVFNCGSWTYRMLQGQGISYPKGAQQYNKLPGLEYVPFVRKLSGGVGVRGMADYTGLPQAGSVVVGTAGVVARTPGFVKGVTVFGAGKVRDAAHVVIENAEFVPGSVSLDSSPGLVRWRF